MGFWRKLKDAFAGPTYKARVEGVLVNGQNFVVKQEFEGDPDDPQQREALLAHVRHLIFVERGVHVATLKWVGCSESYPTVQYDGKARFEAVLADGRVVPGKIPYQGTLDRESLEDLRTAVTKQILVQTGIPCTAVRFLGAY